MNNNTLSGLTILITRPVHQATPLANLIKSAGGNPVIFPTLEIISKNCQKKVDLTNVDLAIFTSPNAVHTAKDYLSNLPDGITVVSMGDGTTQALQEHQINIDIQPNTFSTEGLLDSDSFQELKLNGKIVAIFKGVGGRTLLKDTLEERGAIVIEIDCYKRAKPDTDITPIIKQWKNNQINLVISTSAESLQNLYDMLGSEASLLSTTPLLVISERLAMIAVEMGLDMEPLVAKNASNEGMLSTIRTYAKRPIRH